jgi:hypothetical protein
MKTIYSISVGLACITDKKRGGHFPYIDHDKGIYQRKGKLKICVMNILLCNIKITISKKIYKIKSNKIGTVHIM